MEIRAGELMSQLVVGERGELMVWEATVESEGGHGGSRGGHGGCCWEREQGRRV